MNRHIPEDAKKVFETKYFALYQKDTEQFDGSVKTFEWVRAYDVVKSICVVDDKIIVLDTYMPWDIRLHCIPWGMIDVGEDADMSIRRETEEETGIVFWEYTKLVLTHCNVWLVESYKHYYLARNPISFGEQRLDPGGEKITVEYITFDQMLECIKNGEVFRDVGDWILRNYIITWKEEDLKKLLFG